MIIRAVRGWRWGRRRSRSRRCHGDGAKTAEHGRSLLRDRENILLRVDDEFHVERRPRAAGRGRAKTSAEMFAFAECADAVRRNRLTE